MDPKVQQFRIVGVCTAVFQAFTQGGEEPDLEWIWAEAEALVQQGVQYAFPCGTNGEGVCMSVDERKKVAEAWVKASAGRVKVIVHVGAESAKDVEALARHAEACGADAVCVMPPTFFKPEGGVDAVVTYLTWACGLTALPMYYYHIPARTGVAIRVDAMLEKISAHVDGAVARGEAPHPLATFRGIKYSDQDKYILSRCLQVGVPVPLACTPEGLALAPRYDICFGSDEQVIAAAAMGVKGAVGSTYAFVGRSANAVFKCVEAGDWAGALVHQRRVQAVITPLIDAKAYGPLVNPMALQKAMLDARMDTLGIKHCATGGPRYPWNGVLPEEGRKALIANLEAMGWGAW